MTAGMDLAAVAALVGDPGRANMLAAMMDGRAHSASALAAQAGVTAQTASLHLRKLVLGRLASVVPRGRHRYFRLASAEVARMLEGMMVVAADTPPGALRAVPRIDPALRRARTCYDHMAGELGVAVADALVRRGAVTMSDEGALMTEPGRALLARLGLALPDAGRSRRPPCRACLDWSERRPHLAGLLGAALLERALSLGVVRRRPGSRVLECGGLSVAEIARRLSVSDTPPNPSS